MTRVAGFQLPNSNAIIGHEDGNDKPEDSSLLKKEEIKRLRHMSDATQIRTKQIQNTDCNGSESAKHTEQTLTSSSRPEECCLPVLPQSASPAESPRFMTAMTAGADKKITGFQPFKTCAKPSIGAHLVGIGN